jgi:hypothetical protein
LLPRVDDTSEFDYWYLEQINDQKPEQLDLPPMVGHCNYRVAVDPK